MNHLKTLKKDFSRNPKNLPQGNLTWIEGDHVITIQVVCYSSPSIYCF
jgi:hypothetical protein